MPNPIKYNVGAESLALKRGNFWIGTGDVQKSPTSTTGFYNGITPPSNGYTIYQNKASDGPSIYVASTDAQLIYFTNHITNGSYTTVNQCLTYFATQTDKMVFNRDYEPIVTNGLVLNLDPGFTPSYPKSGSTFYDLSAGGFNGTMIGTPPLESDGGGCFNFSGVTGSGAAPAGNASQGFSFASNMIPTTGSFTLSAWIKNPPTSSGQVTLFSNAGSDNGYRWGIGLNGAYVLIGPSYSELTLSFNSSLLTTSWYNVVTVFDRSGTNSGGTPQWQLYSNGVYQTATNMLSSQTAFTGTAPGIVRNPCCDLYTGKLGVFLAYNRALSAAEILSNYNAQKARYGL